MKERHQISKHGFRDILVFAPRTLSLGFVLKLALDRKCQPLSWLRRDGLYLPAGVVGLSGTKEPQQTFLWQIAIAKISGSHPT